MKVESGSVDTYVDQKRVSGLFFEVGGRRFEFLAPGAPVDSHDIFIVRERVGVNASGDWAYRQLGYCGGTRAAALEFLVASLKSDSCATIMAVDEAQGAREAAFARLAVVELLIFNGGV